MEKVTIAEKFAQITQYWQPKIAGRVDDYAVKLAKLHGEFIWHHHEHEDELFMVVHGQLTIRLRDGEIVLNPGEFVVIPKGVEHQPVAEEECHVLLFERESTLNTGAVVNERTVHDLDEI